MKIFSLSLRNRYVLYGLAIVATYVVFAVLQVNHFVGTLLRGNQYYIYYLTYVLLLYLFFCLYSMRTRAFGSLPWSVAFGALAGYVAGLIAYFALVLSMGDGFARIANSAPNPLSLLVVSAIYFGWAYGALAAGLVVYLFARLGGNKANNGPPLAVP